MYVHRMLLKLPWYHTVHRTALWRMTKIKQYTPSTEACGKDEKFQNIYFRRLMSTVHVKEHNQIFLCVSTNKPQRNKVYKKHQVKSLMENISAARSRPNHLLSSSYPLSNKIQYQWNHMDSCEAKYHQCYSTKHEPSKSMVTHKMETS